MEEVILVDRNDQEIGLMEKMDAHRKGLLHRAFSVFIFNSKNELLLQRRALEKYHSPGLWTNTCCSHPRKGETTLEAAHRRLNEEMGMQVPDLSEKFSFIYNEKLDNELTEHELDHVFFGFSDELPVLNSDEVCDYRYISLHNLQSELILAPDTFTIWFKICFEEVLNQINHHNTIKV